MPEVVYSLFLPQRVEIDLVLYGRGVRNMARIFKIAIFGHYLNNVN